MLLGRLNMRGPKYVNTFCFTDAMPNMKIPIQDVIMVLSKID